MSNFLNSDAGDPWELNHNDMSMMGEPDLFALLDARDLQDFSHIDPALLAPAVAPNAGHGSCTGNPLLPLFTFALKLTRIAGGSQYMTAMFPELSHTVPVDLSGTPSSGSYAPQRTYLNIQPTAYFGNGPVLEGYNPLATSHAALRQLDSWTDSSSSFQEPFVPFPAYPSHIRGSRSDYSVPARFPMTMMPAQSDQVHPPWPCDTSHGPCLLLHWYLQLLHSHAVPALHSSPTSRPMPDSVPNPDYMLSTNEALNTTAVRHAGSTQHLSACATTSPTSSSIPEPSVATAIQHHSPTATELNMSSRAAEPSLDGSHQGMALEMPFLSSPVFSPPFPSILPTLTRSVNTGHDAMPLASGCIKENASPPTLAPEHTRIYRRHTPRKPHVVSKQLAGVSRTQRTLLPKP